MRKKETNQAQHLVKLGSAQEKQDAAQLKQGTAQLKPGTALVIKVLLIFLLLLTTVLTGCQSKTLAPGDEPTSQGEVNAQVEANARVEPSEEYNTASDADVLEDMKKYRFFKGNVLIDEEQSWKSKFEDASHGEGSAQLAVEELIAYDANTQKAYIVTRSLKYTSQHLVTVNDLHGTFIDKRPVDATGELTECYGLGVDQDGTFDLSGLPVRIDQVETRFYTIPATHNTQWVAYRSAGDTIRWSIERIGPPEFALDSQLQQIPMLDTIANTKTYGNRQSAMYEATNRLWNVKGTVDYSYDKIDSAQALDYLRSQIQAIKLANGYVSPAALASLGGDYLKLWEALDQLAHYSHQAASAGQSIFMMPVTNPPEIAQLNREKLTDALDNMTEIGKQSDAFDLLPEGEGFVLDLETRIAALKGAKERYVGLTSPNAEDKAALVERLAPFLGYLQRYEEAVQGLMTKAEGERTLSVHKEALRALMAKGFSEAGAGELNMEAQVEMPQGYPLEVLPIPESGRLVMAEALEGGGFNLTFVDQATEAKLVQKYEALLSRHSEYSKMKIQGMTIITANKAPWSMSVTIGPNQLTEEGGMMVNLTAVPLE